MWFQRRLTQGMKLCSPGLTQIMLLLVFAKIGDSDHNNLGFYHDATANYNAVQTRSMRWDNPL